MNSMPTGGQSVRSGLSRRNALHLGCLSLFGGMSLRRLIAAETRRAAPHGKARSVILINLFGGPPHIDMFDMKPEAPSNVRGEFSPIETTVPGIQICELLPQTALLMDRATLIRTYSHKYNSHNPYNVMTGFDMGIDAENYYAKRTDHPSIGSVCQWLDPGPPDVPCHAVLPAFPGYTQSLRRAGPYGGYLGTAYDPLFSTCNPSFARQSANDYDPVPASGFPVLPALDELADMTSGRFDRRASLLTGLDRQLEDFERTGALGRFDESSRRAFALLTSGRTRNAFDLSAEDPETRQMYGEGLWTSSALVARRLIEAGSKFVTVNWEARNGNHWDLHSNNFGMLRGQLPVLDRMVSALVRDLEQRGLLDETLVVVMGEMGRSPKINSAAGRDHWPQCGFSLLFGGGTHRGAVVGRSDNQGAWPEDRPVSAGDMVATIYHLLGVDPTLTVPDLSGRPVHICHGGQQVYEAIA
jgi:hypothetical protein